MAKKQPRIALPGQLEGPDTQFSTDQTAGDVPKVDNASYSFPKWKYHSSGQSILIDNEDDEQNLGDEWQDSPAAFVEEVQE